MSLIEIQRVLCGRKRIFNCPLLGNGSINTYTYQTSMPCLEFEPTIPASERAKTVNVLNRSATVTGEEDFKGQELRRRSFGA
jgi:hypothetical protein